MSIASLFRRTPHRQAADIIYPTIVGQAREPIFFTALGVPDTLDGRFELLALHAFLVLNRLKRERPQTTALSQELFDSMFADIDRGLRESGVGDLSVGKHVKRMASGFYGRIRSYEEGLAGSDETLAAALARNLFGTVAPTKAALAAMADYMRRCAATLDAQTGEALLAGDLRFALPPAPGTKAS